MNVLRRDDPFLKIGETNDRSKKGVSDYVWALKDINLEIDQGDVVGIIGKNGAGKSTLLKILSRVTKPSTGSISYKGRIASLLEVGTGFHPEMTGRENIYMNGAIMGMTRAEITRKLDEIVNFAGIERYIDTPTKRYSSGMTVRLGFAIAAHLEPEILVVDEVLAVGDAEFQKKAIGKMQDVSKGEGRTVLFVSHNMGSMQQLCKKGILLENGYVTYSGKMLDTIDKYLSIQGVAFSYQSERNKDSDFFVKTMFLQDEQYTVKNNFKVDEAIIISSEIIVNNYVPETYILITILDKMKRKIFSAEKKITSSGKYQLCIHPNFLTRGMYSVQSIIYKPAVSVYEIIEDTGAFEIMDSGSRFSHLETFDYGCVFGSYKWLD
jgi:lipopolysaccharide transport system ATP-binding protein